MANQQQHTDPSGYQASQPTGNTPKPAFPYQLSCVVEKRDENGEPYDDLQLAPFNTKLVTPGRLIFLIGNRKTGKTVLLEALLRELCEEFDFVVLMTPTQSTADMLKKVIPPSLMHVCYDKTLMPRVLAVLRQIAQKGHGRRVAFIADDLMHVKDFLTSEAMSDMAYNGRHCGVTFIALAQYVMLIPRGIRAQIEIAFAFAEKRAQYRQSLYENLFDNMTRSDFEAAFDHATQNYGCLVTVNDASIPNHRLAGVFQYRANIDDKRPYTLCSRAAWKLHHMYYKHQEYLQGTGLPPPPIVTGEDPEADPPVTEPAPVAAKSASKTKSRSSRSKKDTGVSTKAIIVSNVGAGSGGATAAGAAIERRRTSSDTVATQAPITQLPQPPQTQPTQPFYPTISFQAQGLPDNQPRAPYPANNQQQNQPLLFQRQTQQQQQQYSIQTQTQWRPTEHAPTPSILPPLPIPVPPNGRVTSDLYAPKPSQQHHTGLHSPPQATRPPTVIYVQN